MTTTVDDGPDGRREAARVLAAGGLVAVPTDTVYGIAVALETPGGIERLFAAKSRPPDKAIALLLADAAQAAEIGDLSVAAEALAAAFWPGGLTLVSRPHGPGQLPAALTGGELAPGASRPWACACPPTNAPRASHVPLGRSPRRPRTASGEPERATPPRIEALPGEAIEPSSSMAARPPAGRRRPSSSAPARCTGISARRRDRDRGDLADPGVGGLPGVGR
jgi:hypothetical protein